LLSLGGGTVDDEKNREMLEDFCVVYVRVPIEDLLIRIKKNGYPSYLDDSSDPEKEIRNLFTRRVPIFEKISDIIIDNPNSIKFKELILDSTRKILDLVQNNKCN
jgi:shikimate kinase